MKACFGRQEALLLDVYGELPAGDRPAWESHLEGCAGCREERQRLVQMLLAARKAMPAPGVLPQETKALQECITRRWTAARSTRWWHGLFLAMPLRPVPALVVGCLLLAAVGWFGLRGFQTRLLNGPVAKTPEQVMVTDLEILENLDLLEEMDDVEKVVRVVDQRDIVL